MGIIKKIIFCLAVLLSTTLLTGCKEADEEKAEKLLDGIDLNYYSLCLKTIQINGVYNGKEYVNGKVFSDVESSIQFICNDEKNIYYKQKYKRLGNVSVEIEEEMIAIYKEGFHKAYSKITKITNGVKQEAAQTSYIIFDIDNQLDYFNGLSIVCSDEGLNCYDDIWEVFEFLRDDDNQTDFDEITSCFGNYIFKKNTSDNRSIDNHTVKTDEKEVLIKADDDGIKGYNVKQKISYPEYDQYLYTNKNYNYNYNNKYIKEPNESDYPNNYGLEIADVFSVGPLKKY